MTAKPSYEELERRVQELEKIESELEYSKEMLQVYEKASLGYQSLDENGHYITVNQNWLDTLGYDREEVIGKSFADFIHPDWRHHFKENFPRFKSIGEILGAEFEMVKKNGDLILVSLTGKISRDKKGDFHQTHCIFHDIADRKRVEEELRESKFQTELILNATSELVAYHDPDLRIKWVNTAAASSVGRRPEEMIGSHCYFFWNHINEPCSDCPVIKARDEKVPQVTEKRTPDGRHWNIRGFPILEEDKVIGLAEFSLDITELKQAEAAREKLQAQLNQAQKMESIGSLAGGIAHDFNNLLFPIVGLSEMMLDDFPPGSMEHQNLHEIFQAGKRGRELVQQILSFSRQSEQQPIPVHIQKILKEVIKLCRATIPADITITTDIQTDCAQVMADPTQIHQIVMNFITNAYHAVESTGGTITVQLQETDFIYEDDPDVHVASGRYAVLSVTDTGTGIDPAVMNKIFDPYFTTKKKGKGTGLGLATVYCIVKAHGGDIKVHSEVGKGSCFHVYLPLLEKAQDAEPEKEMTPLPTGTEHVLLVDDEKPIVHLEQQMLERLGYRVTSFTSSVDALAAFRPDPSCFDLIITDMNMPHMNGMQLATELTAIRPDIPIILCTGFSERIDNKTAEDLGIKGLLMKPVGMKDLSQKVREVLDTTKKER